MVFSSIPFLYYFLPIVLLCYAVAPAKCKNMVLLLASLVFYAWGEPKLVLLMMVSVFFGYGFGLLIENHRGVTEYGQGKISVRVRYGLVVVCGYGLELSRMTREQLVITGRIDGITLHRGKC